MEHPIGESVVTYLLSLISATIMNQNHNSLTNLLF